MRRCLQGLQACSLRFRRDFMNLIREELDALFEPPEGEAPGPFREGPQEVSMEAQLHAFHVIQSCCRTFFRLFPGRLKQTRCGCQRSSSIKHIADPKNTESKQQWPHDPMNFPGKISLRSFWTCSFQPCELGKPWALVVKTWKMQWSGLVLILQGRARNGRSLPFLGLQFTIEAGKASA